MCIGKLSPLLKWRPAGVAGLVALVAAGWADPDRGEENLLQWLGYRPPTPRPHDPEVRAARR